MKNEKIKLLTTVFCAGMFLLGLISTANAALETRLGGLAIYDTDLDITWLADANAGAGSIFDNGDTTDGRMTWQNANDWVASLNVGGVTGWRLPTAEPACGVPGLNCTNSEMGHLFYNELGGTALSSILSSTDPGLALFTNVGPFEYWSGTEFATYLGGAWIFSFNGGFQDAYSKDEAFLFVWAVHSGDVGLLSPVPEPE